MSDTTSKIRHIRYYADEYLIGVMGLTDTEMAVYWAICSFMYSSGGAIDRDDDRIFRLFGERPSKIKRAIDSLIEKDKLKLDGNILWQKRVDKELGLSDGRIEKNGKSVAKPDVSRTYLVGKSDVSRTYLVRNPDVSRTYLVRNPDVSRPPIEENQTLSEAKSPPNLNTNLNPIAAAASKDEVKTTKPAEQNVSETALIDGLVSDIWSVSNRTQEQDRWRVDGKVDDFRLVRTWRDQGYSIDEIRTAALEIINRTGEIKTLWGLLGKVMPDNLEKLKNGSHASSHAQQSASSDEITVRVTARSYLARFNEDGQFIRWRSPEERRWPGDLGPPPEHELFEWARVYADVKADLEQAHGAEPDWHPGPAPEQAPSTREAGSLLIDMPEMPAFLKRTR